MNIRKIIVLALGYLLIIVLFTSCYKSENTNKPSSSTTITSSIDSNESDQVVMPETIIYHTGGRNTTIENGKLFDTIVALINERLKGVKITSMSVIPDLDFTSTLTGIDTLEFDFPTVQTLSFIYNGINPGGPMLRPGEKPAIMHTDIKFTKLIFPLADYSKSSGGDDKYSLSFFSNGSPGDSIDVNGVTGIPIYQNFPIASLDKLINFLNEEKAYLTS